jgi:hypothetical protein
MKLLEFKQNSYLTQMFSLLIAGSIITCANGIQKKPSSARKQSAESTSKPKRLHQSTIKQLIL